MKMNKTVIATSNLEFALHVVVHNVQERLYEYKTSDGKEGQYARLLVLLYNRDSQSIFGNQFTLILNPKTDTAYARLKQAKPNDEGLLKFKLQYQIFDETRSSDGTTIPFTKEVELHIVDFEQGQGT